MKMALVALATTDPTLCRWQLLSSLTLDSMMTMGRYPALKRCGYIQKNTDTLNYVRKAPRPA